MPGFRTEYEESRRVNIKQKQTEKKIQKKKPPPICGDVTKLNVEILLMVSGCFKVWMMIRKYSSTEGMFK